MRRKERERTRARHLRAEGWHLRRIANELGVALSSVSVWVRDVPLPPPVAVEPGRPSKPSAQPELGQRRCGRCGLDLSLTSFNRHPKGHQWWCRDCYRAYFRARGQLHRDQSRGALIRRREEARAYVDDYLKRHPCLDCGNSDPLVLEFDHVGVKHADLALLVAEGAARGRIEREIANCEVVCVNCHRIRTASRGDSWRLDPMTLDQAIGLTWGERRNMAYVRDYLKKSRCTDCGEGRLIVLDFDHVGVKRGHVTELARRGCRLATLIAEISKCEVRCGNCHRHRTRHRLNPNQWPLDAENEKCPRQDSNLQPSP